MKRKLFTVLLFVLICFVFCSCKKESTETSESTQAETKTEDSKPTKEDFKNAYDLVMLQMQLLTADAAGIISDNLKVWKEVGADFVSYGLECIRAYGVNGQDDDFVIDTICFAYGLNSDYKSSKEAAMSQAKKYGDKYKDFLTALDDSEELFKSFKDTYGDYYDISELKEYYIEVSSYADLAINLKGSYKSYSEDSTTYLNNIDRLKKAAEIAY